MKWKKKNSAAESPYLVKTLKIESIFSVREIKFAENFKLA